MKAVKRVSVDFYWLEDGSIRYSIHWGDPRINPTMNNVKWHKPEGAIESAKYWLLYALAGGNLAKSRYVPIDESLGTEIPWHEYHGMTPEEYDERSAMKPFPGYPPPPIPEVQ